MKAAAIALVLTVVFFGAVSAANMGGDITPPVLVAASADRYQIDTSSGAQTVVLTLHITDDLAGLERVQINYRHEHGYNAERLCFQTGLSGVDVTVHCPIEFPRFSADGRWLVDFFVLTDAVGNQKSQQVVQCVGEWIDDRCTQYDYLESAPPVVRSIVITVGTADPGEDPSLYLPLMAR